MVKLKNCPFCGGEAEMDINKNKTSKAYFIFAKCKYCNAQGKSVYIGPLDTIEEFEESMDRCEKARDQAVFAWNRRVDG